MAILHIPSLPFFFFNDTATTEIYTLSLHDALPIFAMQHAGVEMFLFGEMGHTGHKRLPERPIIGPFGEDAVNGRIVNGWRSEEHTSELQSRPHLVCRLLLEKKKKT